MANESATTTRFASKGRPPNRPLFMSRHHDVLAMAQPPRAATSAPREWAVRRREIAIAYVAPSSTGTNSGPKNSGRKRSMERAIPSPGVQRKDRRIGGAERIALKLRAQSPLAQGGGGA